MCSGELEETNTRYIQLSGEFKAAENLLKILSSQMKNSYGDDLVIRGTTIGELINEKRSKISVLVKTLLS